MTPTKRNRLLLALFPIAVLVVVFVWRNGMTRRVEDPSGVTTVTADERVDFVLALAASENSNCEVALGLWQDLLEKNPKDQRLKFNYVVTAVDFIQDASYQIESRPLGPKEIEQLRSSMEATQTIAKGYMEDLKGEGFELSKLAFLDSYLYQAAARLEKSWEESEKWYQAAAKSMLPAIANEPASALLACEFDELARSVSDDEELNRKAAETLFHAWRSQPRNLYLTHRCGERLLEMKDARLAQLLRESLAVAKPSESSLNSIMKQPMNFEEWVGACVSSVEAQDWSEPQRIKIWLNLLRGCGGIASDVRQIRPSILSLLDTTILDDLASANTQGSSQASVPIYDVSTLDALNGASAIAWYDHDVDTDFELVVATRDQLALFQSNAHNEFEAFEFDQLASVSIDVQVQGILVADLFEADSQKRPRVVREVLDRVNLEPEQQKKYDYLNYRHNTIQELVVWGPSGIRIIGSKIGKDGKPELFVVQEATGLESLMDIRCAAVADIDSDSDLDLVMKTSSGFKILQNNGNRTFRDVTEYSALPETASKSKRLIACDFDRDMDQDIVTLSADGRRLAVLENIRHSQFSYREFGAQASSAPFSDFDFGDFDCNRSWDWVCVGDEAGLVTTTHQLASLELSVLSTNRVAMSGGQLAIGDLNNDSRLDVVVGGEKGLTMCLGDSGAQFGKARGLLPGTVTALAMIDTDQNGGLDIASIVDGQVHVMLSKEPENGFLSVRVHGYNNFNGGGQINHYAIGSTIELATEDQIQSMVLRDPVVHFGLGASDPLNLRIIFESGVIKNSPVANSNILIEEHQPIR